MRTVLAGGVLLTCDEQHTVHSPGDLVFDDGRIVYAGPVYAGDYDVRLPVPGRLIMPGLINAHTHSPMSIFRSLADDVDLMVFLQERVWPREVTLRPADVYAGSVLSGLEMLKSGVTAYVDMYFFEEDLVRAALDVGIRAVITPGVLSVPAWEPLLGPWERRTQAVVDFCRRWEGYAGRIHTGVGPHAPYTLPFAALGEVAAAARDANRPVHIHLVETRQERDSFDAQGRGSTVRALDGESFFTGPVIAAHSVWLGPGDLDVYAARGVGVAHCPQSNAKLGAGIAPVAEMLARGVPVGLGTDGPATNNNLDLWEEMRLAPLLAKVSALDPKPVPAAQALWMATRLGALAIYQPDLGVLAPGFRADVLTLDLDDTTTVPVFTPQTYIDHAVYAMGRELVDSVWVNGKQVVKGGEVLTLDEATARRAAQRAAAEVSARLGR
jgi:5-methylthioadenosine/S-adenosylhomocysteine deaminase